MQKCPFEAIQIINLPKDLDKDTTHRYGANTFKLHRLVVLASWVFDMVFSIMQFHSENIYSQVTCPEARSSSWLGGNKWYWEVNCSKSFGWKIEAQFGQVQCNVHNYADSFKWLLTSSRYLLGNYIFCRTLLTGRKF